MADDAPKTSAAVAKELAEALSGALEDWPGASDEDKSEVPEEAKLAARAARKKHDGLIRWMLGVFSAVGLLIFGSLPFIDLQDVRFWPWALLGLLLAGCGLAIVIWAATTGLEIGDVGLGELKNSIEHAQRTSLGSKYRLFLAPRRAAANELIETLEGSEKEAHLGPGIESVSHLITRIGQLERQTMLDKVGWDGDDNPPTVGPPRSEPAANDTPTSVASGWSSSRIAIQHEHDMYAKELQACAAAIAELRTQHKDAVESKQPEIRASLESEQDRYRELLGDSPSTSISRIAAGKALDHAREIYLSHRKLVLEEAAVSELRGTFHLVRAWLVFGAALTLIGGVMYAYAIANPEESSLRTRVSVTILEDATAWETLSECLGQAEGDVEGLEALLVASDDADGLQDGPFTAVAIAEGCEGTTIEVEEGEGSYSTFSPSDSETAVPQPSDPPSPGPSPSDTSTESTGPQSDVDVGRIINSTPTLLSILDSVAATARGVSSVGGNFAELAQTAGSTLVDELIRATIGLGVEEVQRARQASNQELTQDLTDQLISQITSTRSGQILSPAELAELNESLLPTIEVLVQQFQEGLAPGLGGTLGTGATRLDGANRYETAVLLSQTAYPDGAQAVLIATGEDFPDALTGSSVAGATKAPTLLVPTSGELPPTVRNELARIGPSRLIIIGGEDAVDEDMAAQVNAAAALGN